MSTYARLPIATPILVCFVPDRDLALDSRNISCWSSGQIGYCIVQQQCVPNAAGLAHRALEA